MMDKNIILSLQSLLKSHTRTAKCIAGCNKEIKGLTAAFLEPMDEKKEYKEIWFFSVCKFIQLWNYLFTTNDWYQKMR